MIDRTIDDVMTAYMEEFIQFGSNLGKSSKDLRRFVGTCTSANGQAAVSEFDTGIPIVSYDDSGEETLILRSKQVFEIDRDNLATVLESIDFEQFSKNHAADAAILYGMARLFVKGFTHLAIWRLFDLGLEMPLMLGTWVSGESNDMKLNEEHVVHGLPAAMSVEFFCKVVTAGVLKPWGKMQ